ncbi:MAG: DUF4330 family protein [Clostridia bacterium]|nr:DUF4330 family protein [Clostridia bacterium]
MGKLITKDGKLFGIINIIDLLVVLFVVAAVAVVSIFVTGAKGGKEDDEALVGADGSIEVVFYVEEVSDFVIQQVNKEDAYIYDDACQHMLGKVTDVDVGESLLYGLNSQGEYVMGNKEEYSSAYISAVIPEATRTRFGFNYNLANYGVGHTLVIRADDAKIYLRVYDVRAAQRRQRRPIDTSNNRKYMEMFEA